MRRRDDPGRGMRRLMFTHSMATLVPPYAIVTIVQLSKGGDGPREGTDGLHRIEKHMMLLGLLVRKIVTNDVIVTVGVALQHHRFPGMAQLVVKGLRLPHRERAGWAVTRRRQATGIPVTDLQ